jgi:hypothetical protein
MYVISISNLQKVLFILIRNLGINIEFYEPIIILFYQREKFNIKAYSIKPSCSNR